MGRNLGHIDHDRQVRLLPCGCHVIDTFFLIQILWQSFDGWAESEISSYLQGAHLIINKNPKTSELDIELVYEDGFTKIY